MQFSNLLIYSSQDYNIHKNCKGELEIINITSDDLIIMSHISNDNDFFQAMIDLKDKDPIEYQLKMSQFRTQVEQQKNNRTQSNNTVKCPKCGSANIQVVPRKWSLLTGFMTNKTDRVCVNCKNKF